MNPKELDKASKRLKKALKTLGSIQLDPKAKRRRKRQIMRDIKSPGWKR